MGWSENIAGLPRLSWCFTFVFLINWGTHHFWSNQYETSSKQYQVIIFQSIQYSLPEFRVAANTPDTDTRRKLVQSQGKSRISSCLWQPFIYLQWVWTTPSSEKNKSPFIPWIFELQPIRRPLTLLPAALQFSSPLQRRCVLDAQRRSSDLKSFHMRIFAIFLLVLKGWPKRALPSWAPSFTH